MIAALILRAIRERIAAQLPAPAPFCDLYIRQYSSPEAFQPIVPPAVLVEILPTEKWTQGTEPTTHYVQATIRLHIIRDQVEEPHQVLEAEDELVEAIREAVTGLAGQDLRTDSSTFREFAPLVAGAQPDEYEVLGPISVYRIAFDTLAWHQPKAVTMRYDYLVPVVIHASVTYEDIGTIRTLARTDTLLPQGWLFCNGAEMSRTTYPDLFAAIGTSWGQGDGSTTFNLPILPLRKWVVQGNQWVEEPLAVTYQIIRALP